MQTKTYTVYKYDELPDDAKQEALERYWDINVDSGWWYDYDGKTGFSAKEIKKYRLDIEHSDDLLVYKGLYFDLNNCGYIQFINAQFKHDETARKFLGVPKALWKQVYWTFGERRFSSTYINYEPQDNYKEFTDKQFAVLDRAVERFANKMSEALQGLKDTYSYLTSKEGIKETFQNKDYDYNFTIDGRID